MDLSITASGMVTAVGFNSPASLAAMRAGISGIDEVNLWDYEAGEYLSGGKVALPQWWEGLEKLALRHPGLVREVRGRGLLQAMDLTVAGGPIVESCMRQGLLINCTANTVLRFLPPLIVTTAEVDEMLETLERALASTSVEGGDIS